MPEAHPHPEAQLRAACPCWTHPLTCATRWRAHSRRSGGGASDGADRGHDGACILGAARLRASGRSVLWACAHSAAASEGAARTADIHLAEAGVFCLLYTLVARERVGCLCVDDVLLKLAPAEGCVRRMMREQG